jgi:hypothetical protein
MEKFFILNNEHAQEITKSYASYPNGESRKELIPTLLKNGNYVIPADVVNDPDYSEAFPILEICEIREVGEDEFII